MEGNKNGACGPEASAQGWQRGNMRKNNGASQQQKPGPGVFPLKECPVNRTREGPEGEHTTWIHPLC